MLMATQAVVVVLMLAYLYPNIIMSLRTSYMAGAPPSIDDVVTRQSINDDSLRLVFMSCNRQKMFNPFWKVIKELKPDVLIWMGQK